MSKIIVTLKESISDGQKLKYEFTFDSMPTIQDCAGILWFKSEGEQQYCPIPIANILGVAYKKDTDSTKNT